MIRYVNGPFVTLRNRAMGGFDGCAKDWLTRVVAQCGYNLKVPAYDERYDERYS